MIVSSGQKGFYIRAVLREFWVSISVPRESFATRENCKLPLCTPPILDGEVAGIVVLRMVWKSGRTISIFLPVDLLLISTIVLSPSHTGVCCGIGRTSSSSLSRSIPGFRDWSRYATLGGRFSYPVLTERFGWLYTLQVRSYFDLSRVGIWYWCFFEASVFKWLTCL